MDRPLLAQRLRVLDGEVIHDDQWDGYPAERGRVAGWLCERGLEGGRSVILSGDVHSSWAFEGPKVGDDAVAVEMTTPDVSSDAMARARVPMLWRFLDRQANKLAHVPFAEVTERGYTTLCLTPEAAIARWWHVHPWARDPTETEEVAATFRTSHADWPPRFEPVPTSAPSPWDDGPVRPGLPQPLPERPEDLPRLRRRRAVGLTLELVVPAALGAAAVAALVARRRQPEN